MNQPDALETRAANKFQFISSKTNLSTDSASPICQWHGHNPIKSHQKQFSLNFSSLDHHQFFANHVSDGVINDSHLASPVNIQTASQLHMLNMLALDSDIYEYSKYLWLLLTFFSYFSSCRQQGKKKTTREEEDPLRKLFVRLKIENEFCERENAGVWRSSLS